MTDALPVRPCYGCGQSDDHPRLHAVADIRGMDVEVLYHYDCAPAGLLEAQGLEASHPALKATKAGKRGEDVRKAVLASNLVEKEA